MSFGGWDAYWRFEAFRREADPLDFRRWKRDSQRALRGLYPDPGVRLLDATAGMGDHTINLAEEGFVTECTDVSPVARELTRSALAEAGLDVPVHDCSWESLGERFAARFDLIFNDAIHWTLDEDALERQLRGTLGALRPGGALVFFFADARDPNEGAGRRVLAHDWERMQTPRLGFDHRVGDRHVTLALHAERHEHVIDEHHVYVDRAGDAEPEVHALTLPHVYRWDWHALVPVLERVGYVDVRSDLFRNEAGGYDFAMNRAFRPDR